MKGFIACLVILVAFAGCTPSKPTPPVDPPDPPNGDPSSIQAKLVASHNDVRRSEGLQPLEVSPLLEAAAEKHAQWMADNGKMSHTGDGGSSFVDRIRSEGYNMRTGGENIAAGYSDVSSVMNGWMNSRGHRQNILNGNFRQIGVGMVDSPQRRARFWCVVFATPWGIQATSVEPEEVFLPEPLQAPE